MSQGQHGSTSLVGKNVPCVSIVMAAYNAAPHIERAIESVQAQSIPDWELLIVDDSSSDDTVAVAERGAKQDPRIKIITKAVNGGPSESRNQGIDAARGRWIAILDSDDAWKTRRLESLLAVADRHNLDVVLDNYMRYDDSLKAEVGPAIKQSFDYMPLTAECLLDSEMPFGAVRYGLLKPIFRTDFLRRKSIAYANDIRYAEDFLILITLLLEGGRGGIVGEAMYIYTLPNSPKTGVRSAGTRTYVNTTDRTQIARRLCERVDAQAPESLRKRLDAYSHGMTLMAEGERIHGLLKTGDWLRAALELIQRPKAALTYGWTLPKVKVVREWLGL
jgi:succinoglycan biosynthesis protein ExoO